MAKKAFEIIMIITDLSSKRLAILFILGFFTGTMTFTKP